MKAVRFHEYGGPDVLRYENAPTPEPGPGDVRVRVAGSAFNPADAGIRSGAMRQAFPVALPHVPDSDVSGIVDAVGAGVDGFVPGDAVIGFLSMTSDGGAAQFVVTPADVLAAAPTTIDLADAAAIPSVATTAWQALFDAGGLVAGQRLLVNGAGGSVGGAAVQLAKHAGATVIAITDAAGADRIRGLGADEVHVRGDGPVRIDQVDVLLNLGPDAAGLAALVPLVRDGGVIVNTVPAVPTPSDDTRGVRGIGFFVHSDASTLAHLVALVDEGALDVAVAEKLPLEQLGAVHERFQAGGLSGKVVLVPPPV